MASKIRRKIDIIKYCPKCNIKHEKNGKFCSRTCANSRTHSNKTKEQISAALLGKTRDKIIYKKMIETGLENGIIKPITKCVICDNTTESRIKKTCSNKCHRILQTNNALKQVKHGGGHKGTYKGFNCDSLYELAFIIWHLDHNIIINRCEEIRTYTYNGKDGKYKPDFVVNDKIYEIKGYQCKRSRAKLKYNPDIILLLKKDIEFYLKYVNAAHKVTDLRDLYEEKTTISHICKNCNVTFENYKTKATYCSQSCAGKFNYVVNKANNNLGFISNRKLKLTNDEAMNIFNNTKLTYLKLAEQYNISKVLVWRIKKKYSYAWIHN